MKFKNDKLDLDWRWENDFDGDTLGLDDYPVVGVYSAEIDSETVIAYVVDAEILAYGENETA